MVGATLGATDFSSAVSSFCQATVTRAKSSLRARGFSRCFAAGGFCLRPTPKILASREKNLWYEG